MCPDALSASASPEVVWAALAPQIAGQQKVRVWDPRTGRFGSKRRLSSRVPSAPAAVRIYDRHRRAAVLVLDFDAKGVNTPVEVDRQVDAVVALLGECGGRVVTDRSRSGGRHVYVPLATPLGVEHFQPALRLLRDRFPALDISPMSNDREGHITAPGSACKEGGHRELVDIGLDDAVAAFTERSQPGLIARLVATLGGVGDLTAGQRVIDDVTALGRITGTGSEVRLSEQFRLSSPIPAYVTEWATSAGALPRDGWWRSTSEARQAVIGHAVLRGATLAEVTARVTDGTWPALRASYTQRRDPPAPRIRRDFFAALRWAARIAHEFRSPGHKPEHTGATGREIFLRDIPRKTWLANATKWVEETFPGTAHRWTVLAVLQGLAYASGVAGELINGTPVVAVGGRSLSLAAGLLPETTVWEVLAEIRDIPGAPIHRIRIGAGQLADCYTLVQARDERGRPIEETAQRRERARVEPVHDAWSVLDRGAGRRIYELVVYTGLTRAEDVFAAAGVSKSVGYDILARLAQVGLIERQRGRLGPGTATLDDVAARHHLDQVRADRIERHKAEREIWHTWLEQRFGPPPLDPGPSDPPRIHDTWTDADTDAYLAAVLATGPPEPSGPASREAEATVQDGDLETALALLAAELGATVIADRSAGG